MHHKAILQSVILGIVISWFFCPVSAMSQGKGIPKNKITKETAGQSSKTTPKNIGVSKTKTEPLKTPKAISKPAQRPVKAAAPNMGARADLSLSAEEVDKIKKDSEALKVEVQSLKNELTGSGIIAPTEPKLSKEDAELKAKMEAERAEAAKQLNALEKAVESGLDRSLVQGNIDKLEAEIAQLNAKIEAVKPKAEVSELDKMKAEVASLKETIGRLEKEKAAPPPQPKPATENEAKADVVGYDKGFFLQSEDENYLFKFNGLVQFRFAFENVDEGDDRANEYAFSVNRAELKFTGNVFSKRFQYAFQTEFGKGQVVIKDAYADIELVKKWFVLRAGQWKRPYSRQSLMSDTALQFVDRDDAVKQFSADRDIGLGFHNHFQKSPLFEYAIGLFNGKGYAPWIKGDAPVETNDEGEQTADLTKCCSFTNVPSRFNPTLVARLGFNLREIKGYSEADLEGGPLRFAMGSSVHMEFDGDDDDVSRLRAEVDYILKAYGFSTTGAVYIASQGDGNFLNSDFEAVGYHFQLGHVFKQLIEPSLRYAATIPDSESGDPAAHRLLLGFSLYFKKHNLKWQTDGGPTFNVADEETTVDGLLRSQLQLTF